MKTSDIKPGRRYSVRGDIVDVDEIKPGKTSRSAVVHYTVIEVRPGKPGDLRAGERGSLGIVNFALWATDVRSKASARRRREARS